jgi:CAAX protease family protein
LVTMRHLDRAQAEAAFRSLKFDGTEMSFSTFATLLVCVPVIGGIAKLKRDSDLKDYLGLKVPPLRQVLQWSLITSVYCGLTGLILSLLPRETASDFFFKAYGSANPRWVLWLAVVVAAPIFEELFFRGFLFTGLAASRLRWYGATVITSVLWAVIHRQYDWYEISVIFGFGLILGTVRAITNSTLLTIWLHCLVNVLATVGTAIALQQM